MQSYWPRGRRRDGAYSDGRAAAAMRARRTARAAPRHPRAAPALGTPATDEQLPATFDALASLVAPPADAAVGALAAGPTPLGRGLIARRAARRGAPLLTVELWNALAVSDDPSGPGWFLRLVAWLLHVAARPGGVWPLYRSLLPAAHGSLMHFTPEERSELQSPALAALAERERSAVLALHASVFGVAGELRALRLARGPEDTLWAASMVNSRCFADEAAGEAVSLVVPCADMANHSCSPNAAYQLDDDAGCFRLVAARDVAAGEEVCISYLGASPAKPNDMLLKDHGFVIPGNTCDRVPFSAAGGAAALDGAALAAAGARLAAAGGGGGGGGGGADGAGARRLEAAMRSLEPFCRAPAAPASGGPAPAQGAWVAEARRAGDDFMRQCSNMLTEHATTAEEDEALLQGAAGAALAPRARAAVEARLERKRVLRAAQALLAAYSQGLA
ncbi:MAG: hypothetical protein J3K34DRAFT_392961 [Monoraphidium minutum]|nr:MAG: hypothetical protein J3K34DRAFT_392961 [Monoraphidium minutum]